MYHGAPPRAARRTRTHRRRHADRAVAAARGAGGRGGAARLAGPDRPGHRLARRDLPVARARAPHGLGTRLGAARVPRGAAHLGAAGAGRRAAGGVPRARPVAARALRARGQAGLRRGGRGDRLGHRPARASDGRRAARVRGGRCAVGARGAGHLLRSAGPVRAALGAAGDARASPGRCRPTLPGESGCWAPRSSASRCCCGSRMRCSAWRWWRPGSVRRRWREGAEVTGRAARLGARLRAPRPADLGRLVPLGARPTGATTGCRAGARSSVPRRPATTCGCCGPRCRWSRR